MNLVRVLLFLYIILTPILFVGMIYLSVRTRNFIEPRRWWKKYVLVTVFLFVLLFVNFTITLRLFPTTISKIHISCVSYGDIEQDIRYPLSQSFVGLIDVKDLDYIDPANVFDPMVVGYVNRLYYDYALVDTYLGSIEGEGLLRAMEQHPAFLSEEYPCAPLRHDERLEAGVYFVYMDMRPGELTYQDQWYEEAYPLFSFMLIEDYDQSVPYDLQEEHVKEEIDQLLSNLSTE